MLEIRALSKTYANGVHALAGVTLDVPRGMFGLLGPNGAGKSTLMRMLATLQRPSSGRILWGDVDIARDPDALRCALGYLPQEFGAYPSLSAREFLRYLAAVKGLPHAQTAARVDQCLEAVGLDAAADKRIGSYSGGMRQRVGIAQALLNDPQLLIVDEPTVGLDPEERLRFRNLLTDLAGRRLVILSTHIVSDIEASATALAVMHQGVLRYQGAPETLIAQAEGRVWDWTVKSEELVALRSRHHVSGSMRLPDGVRVRIVAAEAPGPGAQAVAPGLEDAYVWLLSQSREA